MEIFIHSNDDEAFLMSINFLLLFYKPHCLLSVRVVQTINHMSSTIIEMMAKTKMKIC